MRRSVILSLTILMVVAASSVLAVPQVLAVRKQNPGLTACTLTGTNPGGHRITLTFRGPHAAETAKHVQEGWLKAGFTSVTNSCA